MNTGIPLLTGEALQAVEHRGGHLQIIACAGSGKTEVVSQRVASLLADGVASNAIVAFTFTERAAAELKERIALRVRDRLGEGAVDQLSGLYVGTIHAYCFHLLRTYVPRYETYDVIDPNQLTALLHRESHRLGFKELGGSGLFRGAESFIDAVSILENELIPTDALSGPFADVVRRYEETLERYRLLTFGQQIARAVAELGKAEVATKVHAEVRHLIVDEYQDVNPAQEELIRLLAAPEGGVELCVVGDDDQAIYQWRGSKVDNIVEFVDRYPDVTTYELLTNRRCREGIVAIANDFAETISGRLPKQMLASRLDDGIRPVDVSTHDTEADEAEAIAEAIADLHAGGVPYSEIAILARKKVAFGALLDALEAARIPVQPAGRTGLFDQPEADAIGRVFTWLVDEGWPEGRFSGERTTLTRDELLARLKTVFALDTGDMRALARHLDAWQGRVADTRTVDLIEEYYQLLDLLQIDRWDLTDPWTANRVGTLARVSTVIADYESVRRRARPDPDDPGGQVGGEFGGEWYYRNFSRYLANYAASTYEGFEGEADLDLDAVDLLTVHGAKGLEWPVVFVPSATRRRFAGAAHPTPKQSLVPADLFDGLRYSGGDADERRLFYVAMTRARDWVAVSRHERVKKQSVGPSPYFEFIEAAVSGASVLPHLPIDIKPADAPEVRLTYSELASYLDCAYAYRLRTRLGFMPPLVPELGYGRAVHHLMRAAADFTLEQGRIPRPGEAEDLLANGFFLPTANKAAHAEMKNRARKLLLTYISHEDYREELSRTWASERPFELHLPGTVISGRADVIFSDGAEAPRLTLVDYKTSVGEPGGYDLQLQVYADAGRREGLDVDAAWVHDLRAGERQPVDIGNAEIQTAEGAVLDVADRLRAQEFAPKSSRSRCAGCDVRPLCKHRV